MKPFFSILMIAGVLLVDAMFMQAQGASAPLMELRPEVRVDSQGVFLDQVVTGTNVGHIRLTDAPGFSAATVLTRAQVMELVRKNATDFASTNWAGATKIKILRQTRPFTAEDLNNLLTETLQREIAKDNSKVELKITREWLTMNLPAEPLTMRIVDLPSSGLTTLCVLRCEISCNQEVLGTWSIPIEARLWRDVWVAQSTLRRGDRLQTADLSKERRDVLKLKDAFLAQDIENDSLELTDNVTIGSALLNRSVRAHPIIRRGKMVDAVVTEGVMMITVKALALEDGISGQTIRLKNPKSGGEFRGKVQNEETVQVIL